MTTQQHFLRWLGAVSLMSAVACSSPDLSGPTSTDPAQLYYTIALSAHAITMDTLPPYDTLQLTATPRNAVGALLVGAPAPTFTTTDSSVRVSATGLLTARAVRNNVNVIATLIYHGIRLADTAVINVTGNATPPPMFDHLIFGLSAGDSVMIAFPNQFSRFYFPTTKQLQTVAADAAGTQIPGSLVALRTSDVLKATFQTEFDDNSRTAVVSTNSANVNIVLNTSGMGPVTVYASATVYGVTFQDSLQLMITQPLLAQFVIKQQAVPGSTTPVVTSLPASPQVIGRGGIIWWRNQVSDSVDIVFDDPTAAATEGGFFNAGGGDIPAFAGCPNCFTIQGRRFLNAGTVHFHSVRQPGVSGTIIVQ